MEVSKRNLSIILLYAIIFCSLLQWTPANAVQPTSKTTVIQSKDASGVTVKVKRNVKRIVSLAPSVTEVLFSLGLGNQVVGVTAYCDFPAAAKSKKKIGDVNTNVESVLALKPDLIVGGYSLNTSAVKKLRALGQTVYTVEPKNIDQVIESIRNIGLITEREKQASAVINTMNAERQKVSNALKTVSASKKLNVYLEYDPMWTVGQGEFGNDLINLSRSVNIVKNQKGWIQINDEFVIKANPDVILYASYKAGDTTPGKAIKKRPGWSAIKAVKNNRVVAVDANLISRPGPRITKGLLEVAKGVYPKLVK